MVKALVHATRVLGAFRTAGDLLRLRDVVARAGVKKGMCFRLLYSLHSRMSIIFIRTIVC